MKTPRMNQTERAVFAACYAAHLNRIAPTDDNSSHNQALEGALWDLGCFRLALASRKP